MAESRDGEVRLSVRDHGTGIRPEVHERLFDQFFTTKEHGLGMGLAIVRSIVESHGGKIDAENVADGGARFHFTLLGREAAPPITCRDRVFKRPRPTRKSLVVRRLWSIGLKSYTQAILAALNTPIIGNERYAYDSSANN